VALFGWRPGKKESSFEFQKSFSKPCKFKHNILIHNIQHEFCDTQGDRYL